jgi:hypothetical protein
VSYQEEDCISEVRIETCSIVKSRENYKFVFPKMSNVTSVFVDKVVSN